MSSIWIYVISCEYACIVWFFSVALLFFFTLSPASLYLSRSWLQTDNKQMLCGDGNLKFYHKLINGASLETDHVLINIPICFYWCGNVSPAAQGWYTGLIFHLCHCPGCCCMCVGQLCFLCLVCCETEMPWWWVGTCIYQTPGVLGAMVIGFLCKVSVVTCLVVVAVTDCLPDSLQLGISLFSCQTWLIYCSIGFIFFLYLSNQRDNSHESHLKADRM